MLLTNILVGATIKWHHNYNLARYQAKKEHKNILLFITEKNNPFCEGMVEDMFIEEDIIDAVNKDYLAVMIDINEHILPTGLGPLYSPSLYFLTNRGKNIIRRVVGETTPREMRRYLKKVRKTQKIIILK